MPYLLKSKGRRLVMRAGGDLKDPVYVVTSAAWTRFAELPPGIPESGDTDVEVKEVDEATFKKHKKPQSTVDVRAARHKAGVFIASEKETTKRLERHRVRALNGGKDPNAKATLSNTLG